MNSQEERGKEQAGKMIRDAVEKLNAHNFIGFFKIWRYVSEAMNFMIENREFIEEKKVTDML